MTIEAKLDRIIELLEAKSTTTKAAPPPPPAATKPAKASKPAPEPEPEVERVTKEQVSKAVADLLKANKRDEAIKLLERFKAKAVSGIKEEDYAPFLEAANEILLSA